MLRASNVFECKTYILETQNAFEKANNTYIEIPARISIEFAAVSLSYNLVMSADRITNTRYGMRGGEGAEEAKEKGRDEEEDEKGKEGEEEKE